MSAAESARPGPDASPLASVLHLFPTTASRPRRAQRRESTAVTTEPGQAPELSPHEKLAATIGQLFAQNGRSLADADTAEDYLIALSAVRLMLEGARARNVINLEAHRDLDAMVEGMMAVPGLLA